MERTVTIGGREVRMKANAATARHYRDKFPNEKDIFVEMNDVRRGGIKSAFIENLAYIMAWQADPGIPESVTEWLETFDGPTDMVQATAQVLGLWFDNAQTTVTPKKKEETPPGP